MRTTKRLFYYNFAIGIEISAFVTVGLEKRSVIVISFARVSSSSF